MTIHEARQQLLPGLGNIYDQREADTIADLVLENITGLKKVDRIIHKNKTFSSSEIILFKKYFTALLEHKPVQYVLQEAWFYGMKFYVNEHVLIPRPETEELVRWMLEDIEIVKSQNQKSPTILDVGTGSGCIAIALKKRSPLLDIDACDISNDALAVAKRNAAFLGTEINFLQLDFLNRVETDTLSTYDYIISNPPYIPLNDKITMNKNVVSYEPHLALFVTDADPLIFYKAIADFAVNKLLVHGKIFVEMHEELFAEVEKLFQSRGFPRIEIKKDMQGKERMMKISK